MSLTTNKQIHQERLCGGSDTDLTLSFAIVKFKCEMCDSVANSCGDLKKHVIYFHVKSAYLSHSWENTQACLPCQSPTPRWPERICSNYLHYCLYVSNYTTINTFTAVTTVTTVTTKITVTTDTTLPQTLLKVVTVLTEVK